MISLHETTAKTLIRKHKNIDSWFISRYGFNIYRGCEHNCTYCDGRSERYFVEGEFGKDVHVKTNAADLLRSELDPSGKRKPLKKAFILPGGGVGDSYQPAEKKYQLTREVLKVINEYNYPVHMLTKSTLIERDADILNQINKKTKALVSFSLSSVDDNTSRIFEPGLPPPKKRIETMAKFKALGFTSGFFLMPVIPFITDTPEHLFNAVRLAKEAGADYVVFGGMTLKEGRQKDFYFDVLKENYPHLITDYEIIYPQNKWGNASASYYSGLNKLFNNIARHFGISRRIPAFLLNDVLDINDLIVVILDQMDYLLKSEGLKSPYGYAAYSVSQLEEPIFNIRNKLRSLKGVGPFTEKLIKEIINTGSAKYYENLLVGKLK